MKPLPCYHERFPDGALTPRDGARGARMGSRSYAVAGCFGCAAPAGLTREHPVDRRQQTGDREWLLQEVFGAEAGGSYGVLDIGVTGDHDDASVRLLGLDAAEQLDTVKLGHPDVEQDQLGMLAGDYPHHAGRVAGLDYTK